MACTPSAAASMGAQSTFEKRAPRAVRALLSVRVLAFPNKRYKPKRKA